MRLYKLREYLTKDAEHDYESLRTQGAMEACFMINLALHGYLFDGNGIVQASVRDLLYKGNVYRQMARLQGTVTLVYLGTIDLID